MAMWTKQQQEAINAQNPTILVSAAAGSGKTAVLVERIVTLVRAGYRLDRMLIVTFTKAAASEMRQRLSKKLVMMAQDHPQVFGAALDQLESTEISTIHAFCQKVLRNNFQAVGIDPLCRACDDQLKQTLFAEAWLDSFNELLDAKDDADFVELAQSWDQKSLMEMTADLHDFLMSLPNPFDWLREKVRDAGKKPYAKHPWYALLVRKGAIELGGIGSLLQTMRAMLDEPDAVEVRREQLDSDCNAYAALRGAEMTKPAEMLQALEGYDFARARAAKMTDAQKAWAKRYDNHRNEIKKIVKDTLAALTLNEEKLDAEMAVMMRYLRGLAHLTERTHTLFLEKKADQHVIDFNDMEQFTLQILQDEKLKTMLQGEYDHIFVDECQDVSQVQDAILQSLHHEKNVIFMVGDVKQSIYRFRKADPTLFMERLRTFSDDPDANERRIILNKNFRSCANVLEATNQVFRTVMRPNVTELTYEPLDELVCGRETAGDPAVEVHLLNIAPKDEEPDRQEISKLEAEAAVVVERVRELLNTTFTVGEQERKYEYRDMVILLSAAANTAPKLVELLSRAGIPVFYDGAAAFFELPEVQSVKALLSVIDNPMQDVPLLSALKMPPFVLSDHELARIRSCKTGKDIPFYDAFADMCLQDTLLGKKCAEVMQQLSDWRFESEAMRLSDFVWHVMQHSGYYAAVGALPKGELRQANLRMLFQRAQDFENNIGGTLADFLLLCDQQSAAEDKDSAKALGENENLLRIMTMHKSKGLEFPVVFCMQLSGQLIKPFKGDLMMHTQLGVALPYINREMRTKRRIPFASEAFKVQRELDDRAERARLLYVAMTRARELLILIGCPKEKARDVWRMPQGDYAVWSASSMIDWVMQGVMNQDIHKLSTNHPQDANPWNIRVLDDVNSVDVEGSVDKPCVEEYIRKVLVKPEGDAMPSWDMNESVTVEAPMKTSVSAVTKKAVYHDPMPLSDADENEETKRMPEDIVAPLRLSDIPSRPAFMEEKQMTGAERGTLTHRALSLMPLDTSGSIGDWVKNAVHAMAERGIFTFQEVLVLDLNGISAFFRGELGQRMLKSSNVRREWAFNLVLEDHAGTMMQGVIDCAFEEDDGWILVDYKTDRIDDEDAFIQRYQMQLAWYAKALETITGKRVREKWLYAIGKRKAYRVDG